jgi:hypothetical protein
LISKNQNQNAEILLKRLRDREDVQDEINELENEARMEKSLQKV